ncbi:nucleoside diphosphate kinase regulator [Microvirga antarctica]|uniref:nucleoside diphosphate kinase regulator n=1 Tax=Microvirga antarctica TaxID=2819233 RepID=UPI001B3186CB|nr:nucleoside diphosphate kinase regulator [Microvirga antarctica]
MTTPIGKKLPKIIVGRTDSLALTKLAQAAEMRMPTVADSLLAELERAKTVSDSHVPNNIVKMNSVIRFSYDDGPQIEAKLVYPQDANISEGRISVLTPIGAALIGLSTGHSIPWQGPDGILHNLTVLEVRSEVPA